MLLHDVLMGIRRGQAEETEPGFGDDRAEHSQPWAAAGIDQGHVELQVEVTDGLPG